jgi:hypothetical protein
MTETFLSRWSRRKTEDRHAVDEPAAPNQAPAPEPAALTDEEVAALPRIETLTAETDITAFMRAGVPAALRKAALRRAWIVDPTIRDFVGHARDYDYDWNVPGGVPGREPLSGEEVAAMARRMLGEPAPAADAAQDVPAAPQPEEKDHA